MKSQKLKVKMQKHKLEFKIKNIFYFLLVFLTFEFCLLNLPRAHAQTAFSVSPPRTEISTLPGQTTQETIKIRNASNQTMTFTISPRDFVVSDQDETPITLNSKDNPYSASSWIKLDQPQITLEPNQKQEIAYSLNVPTDASPGGHYAMLIVQPQTIQVGQNQNQTNVSTGIGSLLYIIVQGKFQQKAEITTNLKDYFQEYGPINLLINVRNLGNVHIKPLLNITLYNSSGRRLEAQTFDQKNIFPGTFRQYSTTLGSKWMIGYYTIRILGSYGQNNNLPLEAHFSLWIIPWKILVLGLSTLIGLIILGLFSSSFFCRMEK